jgi:hypothetical protein
MAVNRFYIFIYFFSFNSSDFFASAVAAFFASTRSCFFAILNTIKNKPRITIVEKMKLGEVKLWTRMF